jgi:hypothetical protein
MKHLAPGPDERPVPCAGGGSALPNGDFADLPARLVCRKGFERAASREAAFK